MTHSTLGLKFQRDAATRATQGRFPALQQGRVQKPFRQALKEIQSGLKRALRMMRMADNALWQGYTKLPSRAEPFQRNIAMPADPTAGERAEFPFQVHYELVRQTHEPSAVAPDAPERLPLLGSAIHSRQGVFEWVRQSHPSFCRQLEERLATDGVVEFGRGVRAHGMQSLGQFGHVSRWSLLVSAPAQDKPGEVDTFTVPLTEVRVDRRADRQASIDLADTAFQAHLLDVDPAYRDGVNNPMLLSSGCNNLADLHALKIEVSSRIQAGFVQSRASLDQTLKDLAPSFLGAKQSSRSKLLAGNLETELASRLHIPAGNALLAAKRHVPVAEQPPRGLTLQGKAPMCRPSQTRAFRQVAGDNHCGIASLNGFFQADVMSSAQAVNDVLDAMEGVWCDPANPQRSNLQALGLSGLYHPSVIAAMRKGSSIRMTKAEFLKAATQNNHRTYEAMYTQSPEEQWRALCNYTLGERARLPASHPIEISPSLWLTVATGIHADSLERMVNAFLQTKGDNPAWRNYPDRVERIEMGGAAAKARLEERVTATMIRREGPGGAGEFPMICMTHGHYFALARASNGDWLKLDSNGTHHSGIQPAQVFARAGQLAQALQDHRIIHLICEPLAP
ncbi:MAG TPA: hypothetical protein VFV43_08660 [Limnobacter sp.]|nr:hypothetical protein [Limnobacter sp.]